MTNAEEIRVIVQCLQRLRAKHPYPANMKIDRKAFAAARCGYEAAIFVLEKYLDERTEEHGN